MMRSSSSLHRKRSNNTRSVERILAYPQTLRNGIMFMSMVLLCCHLTTLSAFVVVLPPLPLKLSIVACSSSTNTAYHPPYNPLVLGSKKSNIVLCSRLPFHHNRNHHNHHHAGILPLCSSSSSTSEGDTNTNEQQQQKLVEEIRAMRVKEIKEKLIALGLRTDDVFEKEELVMRLVDASKTTTTTKKKKIKKKNTPAQSSAPSTTTTSTTTATTTTSAQTNNNTNRKQPTKKDKIVIPLQYVSMDGVKPIDAINDRLGDVKVNPLFAKLPVITLQLSSSKATTGDKTLIMMVDTACSGFVLRPSAVERHGLPLYNQGGNGRGPVSMTTAGGTASGAGLSEIDRFVLEDGSEFGSLPVAVQDIGALPPTVDGIVGLSFLNQFKSVVFDFARGELILLKTDVAARTKNTAPMPPPLQEEDSTLTTTMELITDAPMNYCRLGIWTADVLLDGRGPVRMLVDTGATATYLNWNGIINDMNLSKNPPHPLVERNRESLGAMGADNQALALTHRFVLKRRFMLDRVGSSDQFMTGLDLTEDGGVVDIDIGDLPVLEQLQSERVNGILGSDLLMRCDVLQLSFSRSSPRISLFQKRGNKSVPYLELA